MVLSQRTVSHFPASRRNLGPPPLQREAVSNYGRGVSCGSNRYGLAPNRDDLTPPSYRYIDVDFVPG